MLRRVGRFRSFVGVVLALLFLSPARAQIGPPPVPTVPSGAAPTRQELIDQLPGTSRVPGAGVPGLIRDEAEAPSAPLLGPSTLSFVLRGVTVQGATIYSEDKLRPIFEPFIGTEVTLGGLREIANRIENRYRDDGYVATRVIIPPQVIADGVATLEVYEGKIIYYEINGDIGPVKQRIASLLDNLLTGEPARWSDLERYLLLARDLPGISLTGTLRSAGETAPGGVILVVDTARTAVDGFVGSQNKNAESTGPFTIAGGAALNSATRFGERAGAAALMALDVPEEISVYVTYDQSLGNDGLRARINALQSYSEPGDLLEDLQLTTNTTLATADLEYPLVRSRQFSFWIRGGADYEDQRTSFGEDAERLFDDQLPVLHAGVLGIWQPPLGGVTEFDVEVRQGLDEFGARADSKPDASVDFTLFRGSLRHRQPLPASFELYAQFTGQRSNEPLPNLEEFALGDLTVGRGYDSGVLLGDSGFGTTVELRIYPPGIEAWWLNSLQAFAFVDYGLVDDQGNPTLSETGFEDLASTGFGFRFQALDSIYGEIYYAQPLTKALSTAEREPNGGVRFALTKFF